MTETREESGNATKEYTPAEVMPAQEAPSGNGKDEKPADPFKERIEAISLGTPEVDTFLALVEEVLDPLSENMSKLAQKRKEQEREMGTFDTINVVFGTIRKDALGSMVDWLAGVSGFTREELDNNLMLQARVLRRCREQGLGDFLGEWVALVAPILM